MVKSGIIYKIYDRTDKQLVYYGSTKQSISKRLDSHINQYKYWKDGNLNFVTSFLVFDANNYDIIIVETVEFEDIKELRNRERFYIENNICVNRHIPNRTEAEYYKANKEQKAEYYKANKDKIVEQKAQYRKANKEKINEKISEKFVCVCGGYYTYSHKSRHEKSKKHQVYLTSKSSFCITNTSISLKIKLN